jgi:HTH-type transcriptional regulator/antitoxin HigA
MEIRPIHTDADYRAVLREVSAYFENEPEPGTPDGDRFEVLVTLVEAYEAKHFPIDLPDPVEAIKFRMEQAGLAPKDLVPAIGRLNRVYEILNHKRPTDAQHDLAATREIRYPCREPDSPIQAIRCCLILGRRRYACQHPQSARFGGCGLPGNRRRISRSRNTQGNLPPLPALRPIPRHGSSCQAHVGHPGHTEPRKGRRYSSRRFPS